MRPHSPLKQALSLLLCVCLLSQGACTGTALDPIAGWAEFLAPSFVPVPGGVVDAAGGNLIVERGDLSIDTLMGTQTIGAIYNSESGRWLWTYQMSYDGDALVDPTGLSLSLADVPDGSAVAGTSWVKVDGDTLATKGGLLFEFDPQGRLASQHWATFDYPRLQYLRSPGSLVVQQCTASTICTDVYHVTLRSDDQPSEVVDARTGRTARYDYDGDDLSAAQSAVEVADGLVGTRYEYDGTLLTAITSSEGERIEYSYASARRLAAVVQVGEGNPTHRFTHLGLGSINGGLYRVRYTNPLGGRTLMYFDADHKLVRKEYEDTGDAELIEWNEARRVLRDQLPGGATFSYEYAGDDPVRITQPTANVVAITYAPGAINRTDPWSTPIQRLEDSLGLVFENEFDVEGRLVTQRDGANDVRSLVYGFATFPSSYTAPSGVTASFSVYGIHGHWIKSTGPLPDERAFDPVGNPQIPSVRNRTGGLLYQEYDADRRIVRWNLAANDQGETADTGAVTVARRSDGLPLYIARPGGGDHRFLYDALGRVKTRSERVDGEWRDATFEYDLAGSVTAMQLPNGMRDEFEYDVYGRLLHQRALRNGSVEGDRVLTYQDGRLETSWDSIRGTVETYGHDAAGRVVAIDFGRGDLLSCGFDLRSRLVFERWTVGSTVLADVGYDYDLSGRPIRVGDRTTGEALVQLDYQAGRLSELRYANGLTRHISYDPETGLATGAETRNALDGVVETTTLIRTTSGNPAVSEIDAEVTTPLGSSLEEYILTTSAQVTQPGARVFYWLNDAGAWRSFSYDLLGNRTSTAADSFSYNAEGNRLEGAIVAGVAVDYTYDEAGFATSRSGVPITWSAGGQMTSFGDDQATWDMTGRLISLEVAGQTRRFDLFGGAIESDATTGAVGALDLGQVVLHPGTPKREFRHFDFRGNVSFVSDEAGQVVSHYRYRPYGLDGVLGVDGGVHFVAKPAIGPLVLLGFRVYDSEVGRFLSPDPILQPLSQYTYTDGNPVGFLDVSGLSQLLANANFNIAAGSAMIAGGGTLFGMGVVISETPAGPPLMVLGLFVALAGVGLVVGTYIAYWGAETADSLAPPIPPSIKEPAMSPTPAPPARPSPGGPGGQSPATPSFKVIVLTVEDPASPPAPPAPPAPSCSPAQLSRTPDASMWLPWLLPLNLILGAAWIQNRWRRRKNRD